MCAKQKQIETGEHEIIFFEFGQWKQWQLLLFRDTRVSAY